MKNKTLKRTVIGTAATLGVYLTSATLFPTILEYRANSHARMEECKKRVEEIALKEVSEKLDASALNKLSTKKIYDSVKGEILTQTKRYLDHTFKEGMFQIHVNHQRPSIFNPINRFSPTEYTLRLEYNKDVIARSGIEIGKETGQYVPKQVFVLKDNLLEKDLDYTVKDLTKRALVNKVERKVDSTAKKAGETLREIEVYFNQKIKNIKKKF